MIVVVLIAVALGVALLWALYREPVPALPPRWVPSRWDGLPPPSDICRKDFPLAPVGYDQTAVDAHLRAVAAAVATAHLRLSTSARSPRDAAALGALAGPGGRTGPDASTPLGSALDD